MESTDLSIGGNGFPIEDADIPTGKSDVPEGTSILQVDISILPIMFIYFKVKGIDFQMEIVGCLIDRISTKQKFDLPEIVVRTL